MNACRNQGLTIIVGGGRHSGQVKNKVSDLPEELILVDVPVDTLTIWTCFIGNIWIGINQANSCECRTSLDCGRVIGVTDELGIIQLYNGCADEVFSRLAECQIGERILVLMK